jgi:hypothetical protein
LKTRSQWQRHNCFKYVSPDDYYYLSCKPSEKSVYGWGTADDYYSCPWKYIEFFKNMNLDYDWYVFIDDDAFVFPDRMYKTLSRFDKSESFYIGLRMGHLENLEFMSGGAGFVLSNKAYNLVKNYIRTSNMNIVQKIRDHMVHGDVSMGQWVHNINEINPNSIKLNSEHIRFSYLPHQNDSDLYICETFHYLKEKEQYDFYGKLVKTLQ